MKLSELSRTIDQAVKTGTIPGMPGPAPKVADEKKLGLAYGLWLLLGGIGVHRFYVGRTKSGAGMAALAVFSLAMFWNVAGFLGALGLVGWWIADAFMMTSWFRDPIERAGAPMPATSTTPLRAVPVEAQDAGPGEPIERDPIAEEVRAEAA